MMRMITKTLMAVVVAGLIGGGGLTVAHGASQELPTTTVAPTGNIGGVVRTYRVVRPVTVAVPVEQKTAPVTTATTRPVHLARGTIVTGLVQSRHPYLFPASLPASQLRRALRPGETVVLGSAPVTVTPQAVRALPRSETLPVGRVGDFWRLAGQAGNVSGQAVPVFQVTAERVTLLRPTAPQRPLATSRITRATWRGTTLTLRLASSLPGGTRSLRITGLRVPGRQAVVSPTETTGAVSVNGQRYVLTQATA